jgi:hypothetical protein
MAYLDEATNSQTVTVATEVALATNSVNDLAGVPVNARAVISGVVAAAAGTGGTTAAVKVRQGSGTGGAQVGPTITSPVQTAGLASVVPFSVVDLAPPATGQYTVTLTFTGNTSSVVTSTIVVFVDAGILE